MATSADHEPHEPTHVAAHGDNRLSINLPVSWLLDVAAEGRIEEWWRQAWSA